MRTSLSRHVLPFAVFATLGASVTAAAQDTDGPSARCRHVRAQAESQAYLLFSPRVTVEAGHVPAGGAAGSSGMVIGSGSASGAYQARAGLAWSPLDFAHGFMALDASDIECEELAALSRARHVIELGGEIGELPARRAEREALATARTRWEQVVARTETRVGEGLASATQLTMVHAEAERLERRVHQLDAEIARLVSAGHDEVDPTSLASDLEVYERRALDLERQQSSIRRLGPWNVTLVGSVVPLDQGMGAWNVDWFGWVSVSYNLGGIAQQFAEDRTVEARAAELGADAGELRHAFERFESVIDDSVAATTDELTHVQHLIDIQLHQRDLLGQLETSEVENLRAMIDLQVIALEAERAHLSRLLEVRAALRSSSSSPRGADDAARR